MIVSKSKSSTLFSITIFELIMLGLFVYGIYNVNQSLDKTWWFLLVYTSGPIGLVVLIKVLTGLKEISISKGKFVIIYPFRFKKINFDGSEISQWTKITIKTYGGLYEEIVWRLNSGQQWSVSKQENTDFEKIESYMTKKYKKLWVKSE